MPRDFVGPHRTSPGFLKVFLGVGLSLLCMWLLLIAVGGLVNYHEPMMYDTFKQGTTLVLIVGLACTTLSVACEITYNLVIWGKIRQGEEQLFTELSGRSRFARSKKKHKLVPKEEPHPVLPRA